MDWLYAWLWLCMEEEVDNLHIWELETKHRHCSISKLCCINHYSLTFSIVSFDSRTRQMCIVVCQLFVCLQFTLRFITCHLSNIQHGLVDRWYEYSPTLLITCPVSISDAVDCCSCGRFMDTSIVVRDQIDHYLIGPSFGIRTVHAQAERKCAAHHSSMRWSTSLYDDIRWWIAGHWRRRRPLSCCWWRSNGVGAPCKQPSAE